MNNNLTEQSRAEQSRAERLLGLDLFRIGATFVVFLFHSYIHIRNDYGVFNEFVSMGAVAMTGFFVLSGFAVSYSCIGKALLKWKDIKTFYIKRMISLWPLYLMSAFLYVILIGKESIFQNVLLLPVELFGVQSVYSSLFSISHNSGTWFISCIWICYLIFPFLCIITRGFSKKEHFVFLIASGFLLLYSPFIVHVFALSSIYSNPFFRLIEFFIGVILCSYVTQFDMPKVLSNGIVLILEMLVLILTISQAIKYKIAVDNYMLYSWIALPIFSLMIVGLAKRHFHVLRNNRYSLKILNYLSSISYAFFLTQFFTWPICRIIIRRIQCGNVTQIIISIIICTVISILFHECIEKPTKILLGKKLLFNRSN